MSTPPSRIAIFAQARSGSTVLYRAIQLHPQLNLALEPFHCSYTLDIARNRETFRRVFAFLGLSTPEGPELDALIDPRAERINSIHTYAMLPNARLIDQQFGNAEVGWLFQEDRT